MPSVNFHDSKAIKPELGPSTKKRCLSQPSRHYRSREGRDGLSGNFCRRPIWSKLWAIAEIRQRTSGVLLARRLHIPVTQDYRDFLKMKPRRFGHRCDWQPRSRASPSQGATSPIWLLWKEPARNSCGNSLKPEFARRLKLKTR